MSTPSPSEITRILEAISAGDRRQEGELLRLVYAELRKMARARMGRERAGQTLQTTALVHEAYLRLVGGKNFRWKDRAYFFAAAAEAMRRILIERARKRARLKRGGGRQRVTLDEDGLGTEPPSEELLALDEALGRLEDLDPDMANVVKLRYFAGLTVRETANALDVSPRSVDRLWTSARAWLQREVTRTP